jgi:hypothetical protein
MESTQPGFGIGGSLGYATQEQKRVESGFYNQASEAKMGLDTVLGIRAEIMQRLHRKQRAHEQACQPLLDVIRELDQHPEIERLYDGLLKSGLRSL